MLQDVLLHCVVNIELLLLSNMLQGLTRRTHLSHLLLCLPITSACGKTFSVWVAHFSLNHWFFHECLADLFVPTKLFLKLFLRLLELIFLRQLFKYFVHFVNHPSGLFYLFVYDMLLIEYFLRHSRVNIRCTHALVLIILSSDWLYA